MLRDQSEGGPKAVTSCLENGIFLTQAWPLALVQSLHVFEQNKGLRWIGLDDLFFIYNFYNHVKCILLQRKTISAYSIPAVSAIIAGTLYPQGLKTCPTNTLKSLLNGWIVFVICNMFGFSRSGFKAVMFSAGAKGIQSGQTLWGYHLRGNWTHIYNNPNTKQKVDATR